MTTKNLAYDAKHDRYIWMVTDLSDSIVAIGDTVALGTLLAPEVAPQFYNPDRHQPDCQIPDRMFRFCLCEEETA